MTIIRQDQHGLYVLCGGYCFRPDFPVGYNHAFPSSTKFKLGQNVQGRHRGGTPLGTLSLAGHKETWFAHGFYFDSAGKKVSSALLHRPTHEKW